MSEFQPTTIVVEADSEEAKALQKLIRRFFHHHRGRTSRSTVTPQCFAMLAAALERWDVVDLVLGYCLKSGAAEQARIIASYRKGCKDKLNKQEAIELVLHADYNDALKMAISLGIIRDVANELVQRAVQHGDLETARKAVKYREDQPSLTQDEKEIMVRVFLPHVADAINSIHPNAIKIVRELDLLSKYRNHIFRAAIYKGDIESAILVTMHNPDDPSQGNDMSPEEFAQLLEATEQAYDESDRRT